jgi:orotidine-5'-phosphate decarboxylase
MPLDGPASRQLPARIEDRLIVALDLPSVAEARAIAAKLDGIVGFFKLGMWLIYASGFEALLDDLLRAGKNVFPVLWRKRSMA